MSDDAVNRQSVQNGQFENAAILPRHFARKVARWLLTP